MLEIAYFCPHKPCIAEQDMLYSSLRHTEGGFVTVERDLQKFSETLDKLQTVWYIYLRRHKKAARMKSTLTIEEW